MKIQKSWHTAPVTLLRRVIWLAVISPGVLVQTALMLMGIVAIALWVAYQKTVNSAGFSIQDVLDTMSTTAIPHSVLDTWPGLLTVRSAG